MIDEPMGERMQRLGDEALGDDELLSLVLEPGARNGRGHTAARTLLGRARTLRRLSTSSVRELAAVAGVGPLQAQRLQAAFALARRLMGRRLRPGALFASPRQVFEHYPSALRD